MKTLARRLADSDRVRRFGDTEHWSVWGLAVYVAFLVVALMVLLPVGAAIADLFLPAGHLSVHVTPIIR